MAKIVPAYTRKLIFRLNDIGRYREVASWRKAYKKEWRRCEQAEVNTPINPKYRPDPRRWVCTCPYFVTSRFLLCKHLVHSVKPVDAKFFLEVQRNRTTPFWSHPRLIPLLDASPNTDSDLVTHSSQHPVPHMGAPDGDQSDSEDDSDNPDGVFDTEAITRFSNQAAFGDSLQKHIRLIRDFADGLEYQQQFRDHRMLETLEREGARFFRMAQNCIDHERRFNSTRGQAPSTWEASTAMYYRVRPRQNTPAT